MSLDGKWAARAIEQSGHAEYQFSLERDLLPAFDIQVEPFLLSVDANDSVEFPVKINSQGLDRASRALCLSPYLLVSCLSPSVCFSSRLSVSLNSNGVQLFCRQLSQLF